MDDINKTNIVLIPKVYSPLNLSQFRPISLCNVVYKVISNMVVNKFYKVLHLYIDETQCAFVLGYQIIDNILIAHEILHLFKKKRRRESRLL